jgi:hypothetical protein
MLIRKLTATDAVQKPSANQYLTLNGGASMGHVYPREPLSPWGEGELNTDPPHPETFPPPILKSPISNLRNDILHKQPGQRPARGIYDGLHVTRHLLRSRFPHFLSLFVKCIIPQI